MSESSSSSSSTSLRHGRLCTKASSTSRHHEDRSRSGSRTRRQRARDLDCLQDQALRKAADSYWPLAKCLKRLDELRRRQKRKKARRFLENIIVRLAPAEVQGLTCRHAAVRFVALSDTHRYHNIVDLPAGEVLLFIGDAVGNYGRDYDLPKHFESFLAWLSVQRQRFAWVFFIAGNHETLLDEHSAENSKGLVQLKRFLADATNCTYLENASARYRGIRLFGSPVTVSRVESEGKRYYSRAFERPAEQRARLWGDLPEGLDLLMTHVPPFGRLCGEGLGDPLLASRLAMMLAPPRFHVFGHDHDWLGVDRNGRTVYLNVAQDQYLRLDPHGGGCPLLFDIEARDAEED